jgi:hypothetical protein
VLIVILLIFYVSSKSDFLSFGKEITLSGEIEENNSLLKEDSDIKGDSAIVSEKENESTL